MIGSTRRNIKGGKVFGLSLTVVVGLSLGSSGAAADAFIPLADG
ncbi:hypothetical protein ACLMAJ_18525 [Nocardia sp. KC 131]